MTTEDFQECLESSFHCRCVLRSGFSWKGKRGIANKDRSVLFGNS